MRFFGLLCKDILIWTQQTRENTAKSLNKISICHFRTTMPPSSVVASICSSLSTIKSDVSDSWNFCEIEECVEDTKVSRIVAIKVTYLLPLQQKKEENLSFFGGESFLDPRDCAATLLLSHIHIRTSFDIPFLILWSRADAKRFEPIEKLLSTTFVLPVSLRQPPTTF